MKTEYNKMKIFTKENGCAGGFNVYLDLEGETVYVKSYEKSRMLRCLLEKVHTVGELKRVKPYNMLKCCRRNRNASVHIETSVRHLNSVIDYVLDERQTETKNFDDFRPAA